jgi:hypothetical protein
VQANDQPAVLPLSRGGSYASASGVGHASTSSRRTRRPARVRHRNSETTARAATGHAAAGSPDEQRGGHGRQRDRHQALPPARHEELRVGQFVARGRQRGTYRHLVAERACCTAARALIARIPPGVLSDR